MNSQRFSYIIKQHNDNTIERIISDSRPEIKDLLIKYYRNNEFDKFIKEATKYGHIKVLEWGASHDPKILPTLYGMNSVAGAGRINVLEWGASQDPKILPTQQGMDCAAEKGHVNMLVWGASQNPKILPTQFGMDWADRNGHIATLEWCAKILPL